MKIKDVRRLFEEDAIPMILSFDRTKIKSIFIWTMKEYQQTVALYSIKKTDCKDEIEAFIHLWLASEIDYENWFDLNVNIKESDARNIFKYSLVEYINKIDYQVKDNDFVSSYVKDMIDEKIELVKHYRFNYEDTCENYDIAKIVRNGIFINYKYTNEMSYSFNKANVKAGCQLIYDSSYAGYRDLFFKNESEYFFFTE